MKSDKSIGTSCHCSGKLVGGRIVHPRDRPERHAKWCPVSLRAGLSREEASYNCLRNGLKAICTAGDGAPFTDAYRNAGGGYEGLQAIAEATLDAADEIERGT